MIRKFDETEQYDTSMKIIFATNNAHKLSEVQAVLGKRNTVHHAMMSKPYDDDWL